MRHDIFSEISRNRESSITFSDVRVIKNSSHIEILLDYLYDRYIGRNFAGNETAESILTKTLRTDLHRHGIWHLKSLRIEDDVVPVTFPLGHRDDSIHAIKPLAFSQKSPLSIFDYGSSWKNRLEYLLSKNKIRPHNILLAIQPPATQDSSHLEAFHLAEDELRHLPLEIVRTPLGAP
ncbi:hypothetical protein V2S84_26005, partial [Azotobacter chroococcum]|nr:hypothetical protein [Azotobacter chroococcum]